MFGFGRAVDVFPVAFREGILHFRSTKKLSPGKSAKVKLLLAGQDCPVASVKVLECDENLDDFSGTAVINERQKTLEGLIFAMTLAGVEGACRRKTKRLAATVRIRSKDLPNYRAITANVNLTGAEIHLDGPLPVGTLVAIEFDDPGSALSGMNIQAVGIWTTEEPVIGKSTYRAGVEFVDTDTRVLDRWTEYYNRLLESEGASVMMKTMGDGGGESGRQSKISESGRQTTVLEPEPEETSQPAFTPPTINPAAHSGFQPPAASSPPSFASPTGPPAFQPPPNSNPTFHAPANPSVPNFSAPTSSSPQFPAFSGPTHPTADRLPVTPLRMDNLQPPNPPPKPPIPPPPSVGGASPLQFQNPGSPTFNTSALPLGFQPNPSQQPPGASIGFTPTSSGGFMPPPAPGNFTPPPAPSGFSPPSSPTGFVPPPPPSVGPERVQPLGMSGEKLIFRTTNATRYQVGVTVAIELSLSVGGKATVVPIKVRIAGIEEAGSGSYNCLAVVLEPADRIQALNQLIR